MFCKWSFSVNKERIIIVKFNVPFQISESVIPIYIPIILEYVG